MNDSSRRPRRPYPGLVASVEVRRSLLIGAAPLEAYASGALTSLRILPSSLSNSTGLVSNSSHPAASAFSRSPASAWADRPMTGMSRVWLVLQAPCRFRRPASPGPSGRSAAAISHPFSRSSATCTSNFELIGELKPHLEHVSVDLVVFDVENTEHGSPLG